MTNQPLTPEDLAHLDECRALERNYRSLSDPYGGSGSSSNPVQWFQGRHPIVEAMHHHGDFADIGCAAGDLAASLVPWGAARGINLVPHGVDISAALVKRARARLPECAQNFHVGNVWFWEPPRRYDFVVVLLDVLPPARLRSFLHRLYDDVLAPGGRLIGSWYLCAPPGHSAEGREDPRRLVERSGLRVDGEIVGPIKSSARHGAYCTRTVWVEQRPEGPGSPAHRGPLGMGAATGARDVRGPHTGGQRRSGNCPARARHAGAHELGPLGWHATPGEGVLGLDEALRQDLLSMQAEDQAMRLRAARDSSLLDPGLDRRHTARLKQIVAEHGYPGKSLVGIDGSSGAWLLAQHAGQDRNFQKEFLGLMGVAVPAGEAKPRHYAYLTDRVRLAEGRRQGYGTQYRRDGDVIALRPVEDPGGLDERRRFVGLEKASEYLVWALAIEEVQRRFQIPHPNAQIGETAPGQWRAVVSGGEVRVHVDIAWDADRQECRVAGEPERGA